MISYLFDNNTSNFLGDSSNVFIRNLRYLLVEWAVMVQGLTLPSFTSMIMGSIPGLVKDIF
jgi:hypothetical protein